MKYLLLLKQTGNGCDYMIGCGMLFEEIELSSDIKEASKEASEYIREEHADTSFKEVLLVPTEHVVDVLYELNKQDQMAQALEQQKACTKAEQQERAELQRLKEKYD
jgi:hypothetical protein